MTTRRQFMGYAGALAAAAPTTQALAQAVSGSSKFTESGLVGTLQGATLSTTIPTSFKEAPQLAQLVKDGKLPPVEKRLPAEPLVIKPLESTGIGLTIVKKTVELYGGAVRVESEPGRGAAFFFTVPKGLHPDPDRLAGGGHRP